MSIQLVFHNPDSQSDVSPFEVAIMEIVKGQELRIACPYLGLTFLQGMVGCSDWRLLTDVDAWLQSCADEKNRIESFINTNNSHFRHYRGLHAKVLIGGGQALVGSANFTPSGIRKNVEVSVAFDDGEQVDRLRRWFDLLWSQAAMVAEADLRRSVATVPALTHSSNYVPLPWGGPHVASKLRPFPVNRLDSAEIARRRENWRIRQKDRGRQHLCMAAIYTALGKPNRGFTDKSAANYWDRLKKLGLLAFRNYTGDPRDNFRRRMSDDYALLVQYDDGLHRLDQGVTAATIGIPPDVADAAETIVSAVEANLTDAEIQVQHASQLRILNGFTE